jgi:hypothetical protein
MIDCACFSWEIAFDVGLDYHSITCRIGKEYGRKQGKLIVRKQQMIKFPAEFTTRTAVVI